LKILLLGSNGQLGNCLVDELSKSEYELIITNRLQIDITNIQLTKEKIINICPDIVINASAYNAVDKAEKEPDLANIINGYAIQNISEICKKINSKFIHVSTDYVFDGTSEIPYTELSPVNPLGIYGKSKLLGEKAIINSGCDYIIIRTSWVFSEYGNNFLKTMIKLASKKEELSIVSDQYGCPTYARDLAIAIIATFKKIKNDDCQWGIYNFSGNSICSWYEFAEYIFHIANKMNIKIPKILNKISMNNYNNLANRPRYSALDSSKFYKDFNIPPSDWRIAVENILKKNIN